MINGTVERIDLNYLVNSIYQKTFNQTKNVRSILKGKLGAAEYNVHAAFRSTTSSVFMTEFEYLFCGLRFYVGWTSLFSSLQNFQLYL